MSTAARLLNNEGFNSPPGALDAAPVISQTAQTLTDAVTGGDHTMTLEAGHAYVVVCTQASVFGLADITTADNVRWVCPAGGASVIRMPIGYTTLHLQSLVNGGIIYLVEITQ
jgi:hypothetical protein